MQINSIYFETRDNRLSIGCESIDDAFKIWKRFKKDKRQFHIRLSIFRYRDFVDFIHPLNYNIN